MILRRLAKSLRRQDWFTVTLEIVIVVLGVFIGIQVSNWNDARAAEAREGLLLAELRAEAQRNATAARSVGDGLNVGAEAARRILQRHESGETDCVPDCWSVVVDLMHASQWQQLFDRWTTYEELRREGLPSDRRVIDTVEAYRMAVHRASQALRDPPAYRTLVRRRIPVSLQDVYWDECFEEASGFEVYADPCPAPDGSLPLNERELRSILADAELMSTLREWTSIARVTGQGLTTEQLELAEEIVASIDAARTGSKHRR
jgi:hypothetical protein